MNNRLHYYIMSVSTALGHELAPVDMATLNG